MNQSKSFQSNYKPEFHRYSAHDGSVESSSSGEADLTPSEMNSPDSEDRGPVARDIIIERTKYSESMSRSQTDRGDHGPPPLPSSVLNGSLAFASISNDKRLALGSRDIDIPTDVSHKHANLAPFCSHLSDAYMNQDHFELSDEDISLFDLAK